MISAWPVRRKPRPESLGRGGRCRHARDVVRLASKPDSRKYDGRICRGFQPARRRFRSAFLFVEVRLLHCRLLRDPLHLSATLVPLTSPAADSIVSATGGLRMSRRIAAVFLVVASALGRAQSASEKTEFFEGRVRPVLAKQCYSCHTENKLGGLRVDSRVALLQGGKSGPAIVPGQARREPAHQGYPAGRSQAENADGRGKLKDNEIADLRYWIQAMAAFWPSEA